MNQNFECLMVYSQKPHVEQSVEICPKQQPVGGVVCAWSLIRNNVCCLQSGDHIAARHDTATICIDELASKKRLSTSNRDFPRHTFAPVFNHCQIKWLKLRCFKAIQGSGFLSFGLSNEFFHRRTCCYGPNSSIPRRMYSGLIRSEIVKEVRRFHRHYVFAMLVWAFCHTIDRRLVK
ncbi:hypothetical protein WI73_29000 [Burkholderia ubonensis]|nr:hypothetical protein WI73_29000 [Burkholderia ubonensis]